MFTIAARVGEMGALGARRRAGDGTIVSARVGDAPTLSAGVGEGTGGDETLGGGVSASVRSGDFVKTEGICRPAPYKAIPRSKKGRGRRSGKAIQVFRVSRTILR